MNKIHTLEAVQVVEYNEHTVDEQSLKNLKLKQYY